MIRLVPGMLALERGLRVLGQVGPKGGLDTTLRTLAVGSKSIGLKKTGRLGGPDINVDKRI